MNQGQRFRGIAASLLLVSFVMTPALTQEKTKFKSEPYKVVLENDRVRVLEFTAKPHEGVCGIGKHSHPAHLTVVLDPTRLRVTLPDGRVVEKESSRDQVFWSEDETHSVENIGKTASRSLLIEIKNRQGNQVK